MSLPPASGPRNNIWLKRNPWFEQDLIPVLRQRVRSIDQDARPVRRDGHD